MKNTPDKKALILAKIQSLYPQTYAEVVHAISNPIPKTFRVNTLKSSIEVVLKEISALGFIFKKGPLENSFILGETSENLRLSETAAFKEGRLYIQSLSSMLPALKLQPVKGEKILDLCAAPGSKTSLMAQIAENRVEITAVENNYSRFVALKKNLETLGVLQVRFLKEDSTNLDLNHPDLLGYFDKVLVDAPCSNEGLICLADPQTYAHWNNKTPKRLSKLQKRLLACGIKMLKPGGTLVYSTCTFSKEENEDVVNWGLSKFPDMYLEKMERIIPDSQMSGFFLAKLSKVVAHF